MNRPQIVAIAAMSADGKITDRDHRAARFGSRVDQAHLETQIAKADAVIFGANTLRAYGTSLTIRDPALLHHRQTVGKPSQPIHIVCSRSGEFASDLAFFQQGLPRWLLTTAAGAQLWQQGNGFDQLLLLDAAGDWLPVLADLAARGIEQLAVLGGGELLASFAEQRLLDELWLTICPILLGGRNSPTPLGGIGVLQEEGIHLDLLEYRAIASELFVHYRVMR